MLEFVATEGEARAVKLAANESAFRRSDERSRRAADSHRFGRTDRAPFVCECADESCREIVMLTIEEYEHVRAHPTWFLLVAGHEEPDAGLERIIDGRAGLRRRREAGYCGRGGSTPSSEEDQERLARRLTAETSRARRARL